VFWLGLMGIILTGSRTIWLLTGLSLVFFVKKFFGENKNWIKIIISLVLILILAIKIIDFNYPIANFLSGWDENGLIKRGQLNLASLEMIKNSPIFGIGTKNFLVNLPNFQNESHFFWLQPVHNILLLTLSEIGFLGLGILIWGLNSLFRNKKLNEEDWLIIGVILISGMVDHYWLTLPQNMWLLTIFLGLI
jgi:O-antigen ligase